MASYSVDTKIEGLPGGDWDRELNFKMQIPDNAQMANDLWYLHLAGLLQCNAPDGKMKLEEAIKNQFPSSS